MHISKWAGEADIDAGETRNVRLAVSESYSGMTLKIPIQVRRAKEDGPVLFITAALHGDEVNGTGAVRHLLQDSELQLTRGSVIFIPVINMLAFDRHSRYLPDRRDLNRCFPGSVDGSLASRMAKRIFDELAGRCDYGIDLHTASVRRTNYPTTRVDMSVPEAARIARAFGTSVVIDNAGPQGSFRRELTSAGCPTIVMEGGEVWKVEPTIVETMVNGVMNVLRELEMIEGEVTAPEQQICIQRTKWIRAERGGFLQFHVKPGDVVDDGQPLATNTSLLGVERSVVNAPFNGVVIGMTTLPAVSPGEPICHIGKLPRGMKPSKFSGIRAAEEGIEERVVGDLASNILVVEPSSDDS